MTRQVEVDGATVAYDDHPGDGPALVLVHGWACRRRDWDAVLAALPGRRAVALDLPWHGESRSTRERWTVADHGAVVARVAEAAGLDDVVLVGHSMGGAVAVEAARLLGPAVRGVVGVDALTYLTLYPPQPEDVVEESVRPFRTDFPGTVGKLVADLFPDRSRPDLIDRIAAEMAQIPPGPGVAALAELYRWDMDAALAAVPVPVRVFASRAYLVPEAAERYGDRVDIVPVDLGGHFYLREQPERTAQLVAEAADRPGRPGDGSGPGRTWRRS